jgi:predicted DNA-binding transcriptional regulator YafY
MPTSPNQRSKLLYLMKILLERTDEAHVLTNVQLIDALRGYGIQAERKSIYSDIDLLKLYGLDIETRKAKSFGYYVASREFELPELKLLVDAIQSSRIITHKKSRELTEKLASLTSIKQAGHLKRHIYVADRVKSINESVYYSIDAIHLAINEGKKIKFKYFDYDTDKKRVYRRDGALYTQTPVTLCWSDDNYYLITYSAKHSGFAHYRVDRMSGVSVIGEAGDKHPKFSLSEHLKKHFGMFSGETVKAILEFDNKLVNVVLDRFGKDVHILKQVGRFQIRTDISASPVFLAWMFQYGNDAKIIAPESLVEAMKKQLSENGKNYSPIE